MPLHYGEVDSGHVIKWTFPVARWWIVILGACFVITLLLIFAAVGLAASGMTFPDEKAQLEDFQRALETIEIVQEVHNLNENKDVPWQVGASSHVSVLPGEDPNLGRTRDLEAGVEPQTPEIID